MFDTHFAFFISPSAVVFCTMSSRRMWEGKLLQKGENVNGWEVRDHLADGGFGEVYKVSKKSESGALKVGQSGSSNYSTPSRGTFIIP